MKSQILEGMMRVFIAERGMVIVSLYASLQISRDENKII